MHRLPDSLNGRHRAGLSLTIIAAGAVLLSITNAYHTAWVAPEAIGVVLIGTGTTWFVGSLDGLPGVAVSLVALCVGLSLTIIPIWRDWQPYRAALATFETARAAALSAKPISEAKAPPKLADRVRSFLDDPLFICEFDAGDVLRKSFVAGDYSEDVEEQRYCATATAEPPFALGGCILSHPVSTAGGCALAVFGLLAFVSLLRERRSRTYLAKVQAAL